MVMQGRLRVRCVGCRLPNQILHIIWRNITQEPAAPSAEKKSGSERTWPATPKLIANKLSILIYNKSLKMSFVLSISLCHIPYIACQVLSLSDAMKSSSARPSLRCGNSFSSSSLWNCRTNSSARPSLRCGNSFSSSSLWNCRTPALPLG